MIPKSAQRPVTAVRTSAASIIHGIGAQNWESSSSSVLRSSSAIVFGP